MGQFQTWRSRSARTPRTERAPFPLLHTSSDWIPLMYRDRSTHTAVVIRVETTWKPSDAEDIFKYFTQLTFY